MKKIAVGATVIIIIALVGLGAGSFFNSRPVTSETPESIVIGTTVQELAGLVFIAEDEGFFDDNGLNVTIRYYDTGLAAVNGMTAGEVDIAASAEYPVVGTVLNHENVSVIGSIDKYQGQYLVGRKDRGIDSVTDLSGKIIGVARGTSTEFYLTRFLFLSNISLEGVTFMNVRPAAFADAIGNGSVDAILVPQAYLAQVEERLGSKAVVWPAQSNQNAFGVLTCRNDWIASHPGTIDRLMESLVQAENYVYSHPAESKDILRKRLDCAEEYMTTIWPHNQYSLTLDQSLLTAMEDEGRWMIVNNLANTTSIPDFRDYIHTKSLEGVRQESVNIR